MVSKVLNIRIPKEYLSLIHQYKVKNGLKGLDAALVGIIDEWNNQRVE